MDLILDVGERARDRGLNVGHAQQHGGEAALDRVGDLVLLEGECGIRDLRVDQGLARDDAEVDVGILGASLPGDRSERPACGQGLLSRLGGCLVLEGDLLQAATLGRVVLVLGVS